MSHAGIFTPGTDIHSDLQQHQEKTLLRVLTAGSVDDGKSTLIGRLLHDTSLVFDDQMDAVRRDSAKKGSAGGEVDLSLLLDGLKSEREQGITIDVAYRYFATARRKFIIADTPGHEQYTRNMATGASTCDLAIILVDARHGVTDQTRRHSFIVSLLGLRHVVVAINKLDLMDYSQEVYDRIRADYTGFVARLDIPDVHFIPVSALKGDNVVTSGKQVMPWYGGVPLLEHLESVHIASDRNLIDLRFPVQYVLRPDLTFRGFAGTVASGVLRPGDDIMELPSRKRSTVKAVYVDKQEVPEAFPPLAAVVTLEDEVDISRGDMLVRPENLPRISHDIEAMLVWMNEKPLAVGREYFIKHTTNLITGVVNRVHYRVDVNSLHRQPASTLELNEIGRVQLSLVRPLPHDPYNRNHVTGAFILIDRITNDTVAAGMIRGNKPQEAGSELTAATAEAPRPIEPSEVTRDERIALFGHPPVTIWITGLPGSGKSSIARALEKRLVGMRHAATMIDGSALRQGISRDLGFSGDARQENVRRAAAIARLFNDAGLITVAALVSPFADDRAAAQMTVGADQFILVHAAAPADACEARDTTGAWAKARAGELTYFTGVSAPYEEPATPDLRLESHELAVDECVDRIVTLLRERGILRVDG